MLGDVKIYIGRQVVNSGTDPFQVRRHPNIVDIFGKLVYGPLLLAIHCREAELVDWMPVEGGFDSINYRIVAIDSYSPVIVRDRESEDFSVKLFFTIQKPKKFNNAPHCQGHAMSILPICDIKRYRTTLHFAGYEREVHVVGGHEERTVREVADKGFESFELIFRERLPPEPYRVVWLWTTLG